MVATASETLQKIIMENPGGGGEPKQGLGGRRFLNSPPEIGGLPLPPVEEDVAMEVAGRDDQVLERMHALLSSTRSQLARAVEEANALQAWSSDEVRTYGTILGLYFLAK